MAKESIYTCIISFSLKFEAPDDKPKPPTEEPNELSPNLSRRNTIVMPPTFQEVEPDMEPEEEGTIKQNSIF